MKKWIEYDKGTKKITGVYFSSAIPEGDNVIEVPENIPFSSSEDIRLILNRIKGEARKLCDEKSERDIIWERF